MLKLACLMVLQMYMKCFRVDVLKVLHFYCFRVLSDQKDLVEMFISTITSARAL